MYEIVLIEIVFYSLACLELVFREKFFIFYVNDEKPSLVDKKQ